MGALDNFLNDEPQKWIDGLESYQRRIVSELLVGVKDPIKVAESWLKPSIANTYTFGSQKTSEIFLENIKKEMFKLLCGDPKYEDDRKKLAESKGLAHSYIIGAISVAIAGSIGSSAVFLAPVVALILFSLGKCTLNALCATFYEPKGEQSSE